MYSRIHVCAIITISTVVSSVQDETISKLQQELHDLHAQYQTQLSTKEQEVNSLKQKTHQKGKTKLYLILLVLDLLNCCSGMHVYICVQVQLHKGVVLSSSWTLVGVTVERV